MFGSTKVLLALATLASSVYGQTFSRSVACPSLGCLYPPSQTDFIAGQVFDIRAEVQAPLNGSMSYNGGQPSANFSLEISKCNGSYESVVSFFNKTEPTASSYNFTYFEDLFARDNKSATLVNVIAKDYRYVALYEPGEYKVRFTYNGGMVVNAVWTVLPLDKGTTKAKNVILFVGDGMTTSMITAARMLGHKSINGKYQSVLTMDKSDAFGMQMTHSLDSYITDSANSATALTSGKKSTVNALNAYTDSTGKPLNNPKVETVFEMGRRILGAQIGIVSTAFLADATPAAVCAHTSQRGAYDLIIDQYLNGVTANFSWTKWDGPDVLFGGGGSDFIPSARNGNISKVDRFKAKNYTFVSDKNQLASLGNSSRALGLFASSNLGVWLDRNVYTDNVAQQKAYNGSVGASNQPGLKEMTLKALDILHTRGQSAGVPFMMLSEAASIDKQMHALDYDRAMADLLELDSTVKATLAKLDALGIRNETLVIVTADHGHGFDVFGSADTKYLATQSTNSTKRDAIGTYRESGLSQYQVAAGSAPDNATVVISQYGEGFPVQFDPRYTAAFGTVDFPDKIENFTVRISPRNGTILDPTSPIKGAYKANPADGENGFFMSGNLPLSDAQGVHSLTDVPIYAWNAGSDFYRGHFNSPDIAFGISYALGLGRSSNVTYSAGSSSSSGNSTTGSGKGKTGNGAGQGNGQGNNGNGKGNSGNNGGSKNSTSTA